MLRILNDMLGALDRNEVIFLALLDLSAAFVVVDHNILIHRLGSQGLEGDVLEWLRSYFTGRTQQVCMDGHRSSIKELDCEMAVTHPSGLFTRFDQLRAMHFFVLHLRVVFLCYTRKCMHARINVNIYKCLTLHLG